MPNITIELVSDFSEIFRKTVIVDRYSEGRELGILDEKNYSAHDIFLSASAKSYRGAKCISKYFSLVFNDIVKCVLFS